MGRGLLLLKEKEWWAPKWADIKSAPTPNILPGRVRELLSVRLEILPGRIPESYGAVQVEHRHIGGRQGAVVNADVVHEAFPAVTR